MVLKNASDFTDEELRLMVGNFDKKVPLIKSIFLQSIEETKYQISLINRAFDSFSQRNATTMTIAGLVSFLPSIVGLEIDYLKNFLIWTFPFLAIALISYYFSSVRPSALATQIPFFPPDSAEELLVLKAHAIANETIWKKYKEVYDSVIEYYRITSAYTYMYLISFTINFYVFVFEGGLSFCKSIFILTITFLVGAWIVLRHKLKSIKNINFGPNIKN